MTEKNEFGERKCHRCGKEFIIHSTPEWVFKRNVKGEVYFCSWSCLRDWEKNRGSKADRREKIINALIAGVPVDDICNQYDVDRTNVLYWQRKVCPRDKDEVKHGEAD